jgi:sigma-B regulation protein RsbU (phosphoserine phosphatase)
MDEVLNSAPCGFVRLSPEGDILAANATLETMLAAEPGSLVGRPFESVLTLPSRIFYQTHLFPLLKIQDEVREVYFTLKAPTGDVPVLANAARRGQDGAAVYDCALMEMRQRDKYEDAILDAKRAAESATRERERAIARLELTQEELTASQEELEQVNVRLRRMMTETHHRVKNNLQVIYALIEMQADEARERESVPREVLLRLGANVLALSAVHDILTLQTKSGGDQEQVSSVEVLGKLTRLLAQTTGGRAVTADVEDATLSPGQSTSLALLTSELISNAVKHGRSDIGVRFQVSGGEACLEVSDDGPGFPPGFDPATATNTGLDLIDSVCRWDLGGQVEFRNRPTGGAVVHVTFPLPAGKAGLVAAAG